MHLRRNPPASVPVAVRHFWPVILGFILGLLALGPGLRRGFLLSYDMVFVPRETFAAALSVGGPPRAVPSDLAIAVASRLLPADIVQKLVLLLIFLLACTGASALLDREPLIARLAAGVYYTWNPYLAERLIIGQWALLLGYAGLPWAVRAALKPDLATWRGTGRLAIALLPAVIGGFAAMAITALALVPTALLRRTAGHAPMVPHAPAVPRRTAGHAPAVPRRTASHTAALPRRNVRHPAVVLAALAVGSLPWLIPSALHPVYADPAGVAAFASRADTPFGTVGSLLMLGGAWNAQTVPKAYGGPWSALWLAVTLAAIVGYAALARRGSTALADRPPVPDGVRADRPPVPDGADGARGDEPPAPDSVPAHQAAGPVGGRWPGLGAAAVAGLLIASLGITAPGRNLLVHAIKAWPGFAVLRDGQQFVAPLALAEALGLGLAVSWAIQDGSFGIKKEQQPARDRPGLALGVIALLAPVLLLPGLAARPAGRLRPAWYPPGWLAAARAIDASPVRGDVLLLPWASYRTPSWNHGEVLLDPWPRLLSRTVIWNDGTRVGNVIMAPDDPRARRLDGIINSGAPLTAALRADGVRFVVVDAGASPAARLSGCPVMISQPGLVVYLVPLLTARGVGETCYVLGKLLGSH